MTRSVLAEKPQPAASAGKTTTTITAGASSSAAPAENKGTAVYKPWALPLYDFLVLWASNVFLWKCRTSEHLLPLFRGALGERHLDVGVGSGYYPAHSVGGAASKVREMTLMDLSPNSLRAAEHRVAAAARASGRDLKLSTVVADATGPFPLPASSQFDSISVFYLLHCIPVAPEAKNSVFDGARRHLAPGGTLAGATILGRERPMNWLAKYIMGLYNRKGVFDNWDDSEKVFTEGLERNFDEVEVWIVGRVMLFKARRPREATRD